MRFQVTGKDFLTPGEAAADVRPLSHYPESHPHAAFDPAGVGDGIISPVSGAAVDAAVEFVEEHAVPLVGILTENNAGSLYGEQQRRPLLVVFLSAIQYSNAFERSLLQKTLRNVGKVAAKHKGVLSFALADQRLQPLEPIIRHLGAILSHASHPPHLSPTRLLIFSLCCCAPSGLEEMDEAGVALISADAVKYRMDPAEGAIGGAGDALDSEALGAFVDGFLAGTEPPYLRSEKIPKEKKPKKGSKKKKKSKQRDPKSAQSERGVMKIVGSQFDELVLDSSKDVLVMLYAPWCENSNAFLPHYEAFAQSVAGIDGLLVAKMDGTRNDAGTSSAFTTENGFPAVYLSPAAPVRPQGDLPLPVLCGALLLRDCVC